MKRLLWMGCLCYALTGFSLVIVGSVLPELLPYYGKSYSDGGQLVLVQLLGLLSGVICMPVLIRQVGRRWSVIAGLLCLSVQMLFALTPPWGLTMPILFVAGFGTGLIESSIGALVLTAAKERPAAAMSTLEITFGLGALTMPFLVSWLIGLDAWIAAFPILGVSALLLAVCWMFMSFRSFNDLLSRKAARAAAAQKRTVERNPVASGQGRSSAKLAVFALCALFYLLYGGTEVSLIQFLPSVFMEQRSASSSTASAVLSVYWIGMTIGRTATGLLADKFGYYRFLLVSTIGAVIALGLLALGGGLGGGVVLAFLVGLFMSGMFAIALIFANSRLPGHTDRTTSLLMAVNGLGGALLPYVSGWTMDLLPVQMTVWLLTGCMALMLGFLVLIRQTDKMAPNAVESLQ